MCLDMDVVKRLHELMADALKDDEENPLLEDGVMCGGIELTKEETLDVDSMIPVIVHHANCLYQVTSESKGKLINLDIVRDEGNLCLAGLECSEDQSNKTPYAIKKLYILDAMHSIFEMRGNEIDISQTVILWRDVMSNWPQDTVVPQDELAGTLMAKELSNALNMPPVSRSKISVK